VVRLLNRQGDPFSFPNLVNDNRIVDATFHEAIKSHVFDDTTANVLTSPTFDSSTILSFVHHDVPIQCQFKKDNQNITLPRSNILDNVKHSGNCPNELRVEAITYEVTVASNFNLSYPTEIPLEE
jgi:hypothetical protein